MAEGFAPWCCPLCGAPLAGDNALKCPSGHSFDRGKEGYWHLLPVQNTRTKAPGDSREMVAARRAFLSADYYGIFGQALGELCLEYGQPKAGKPLHLLDAGCGEGWYDRCIAKQFEEAGRPLELAGFDIAKPAVRRRLCPRLGTPWRPVSISRCAQAGRMCCSTASRPSRRRSFSASCAPADGSSTPCRVQSISSR